MARRSKSQLLRTDPDSSPANPSDSPGALIEPNPGLSPPGGRGASGGRARGRPPVISTERLLDVARQVFLELGIRATTAEVAHRAGIAEGTIFHRFKSKEELFRSAMNFDPNAVLALVEDIPARAGVGDLRETLLDFTRRFMDLARVALPVMMMSWSNPESQLCQESASERVARYGKVLGALTRLFAVEMEAQRLRRTDPEVMARMLLGSLNHFCMTELFMGRTGEALTHQEFGARVVDVLLASSATPQAPVADGDSAG